MASASLAVSGELELQLIALWEDLLGRSRIGIGDNFFDLGGDSLALVELTSRLEGIFGIELDLAEGIAELTIETLARQILRRQTELRQGASVPPLGTAVDKPLSDLLVPLRTGGPRAPLVVVHPSGGSVLCYLELAQRLGSERPVYGLQGPPLGSQRPFPTSVESMAAAYLEVVLAELGDSPPILAGYSFGGLVAYEMARQMAARGLAFPHPLVLFDTRAPGGTGVGFEPGLIGELGAVLDHHEIADEAEDLEREIALWDDLANLAERHLQPIIDRNRPGGSRRRRMGAIQSFFFAYRLFPAGEEFDYRRVRRFLQSLQSNLRCGRDYRGGPFAGDVVLLQASKKLGANEASPASHRERWARQVGGRLGVVEIPAHHLDFLSPPAVETVAAILRQLLTGR